MNGEVIDLARAFPAALEADVHVALGALGSPLLMHGTPHLSTSGQFTVLVGEATVTIPYRIYNDVPEIEDYAGLSPTGQTILDCLYSRHHDGYERQRRLVRVIGSAHTWVVPYVVQLMGEYVVEILMAIRSGLGTLDTPDPRRSVYADFVRDNPEFIDLTAQRIASYWDCYYRPGPSNARRLVLEGLTMVPGLRVYLKSDYPGFQLMDLLRSLDS